MPGANYLAQYHDTYAYVDGLGRTIVTLSEADELVDGFQWVVEGLTDLLEVFNERVLGVSVK